MLRRDRQIRTQIHQLADACLFAVSFWLAYTLRTNPQIIAWLNLDTIPPDIFGNVAWLYFVLIPAAPLILESQGFYNRPVLCPRRGILWPLFKGCLITTIGLVLVMYALQFISPRVMIMFFGCISFTLVYLKEELVRWALRSKIGRLQYQRRFLLIGTHAEIVRLRRELKERLDNSVEVVGELSLGETPVQQLVQMLHEHSINGVIISARHTYFEQVETAIKTCELEGIEAWLVADFFGTQISRARFDELLGFPLLVFRTTPETSWQGVAKQLMDFIGALFLLIALSWLFVILAILIKLTSPGPVFFRQQRSGLNGAPFTLYKFRTMVTNAEQFKHELEAMNEMSGPVFKVTNDPRVTPVGKWLRRYSLDELPQLYNVLRTEMSLVGPRPLPVDEVKRFENLAHRRRLSVKPGLTCLWQISGRNQISDFRDWVRLDLEYIDNWSLWLDLKILIRTIPAVLIGTGAR
ncbi:MAG: sugar transferase [Verrucomicrobiota bacterium]|jgi:exopolysaccharide biosynthesis polyprenyl glycosylphosphotransferase